jgi:hypothetical protein
VQPTQPKGRYWFHDLFLFTSLALSCQVSIIAVISIMFFLKINHSFFALHVISIYGSMLNK